MPITPAEEPRKLRPTALLGPLAVLGASTCFALSYVVIKWPGTPGSVIAWWRLAVATVLWWVFLIYRRFAKGVPFPSRATWRSVTPAALLFGANIAVMFTAATKTSVAHLEFINALAPIVLAPLGFLFFRERPQWKALRWGVFSFAGIAIVLSFGPANGVATVEGDLLVATAFCAFLSYLLLTKRARAHGVTTVDFMAVMMPVAMVAATPVALLIASDAFIPDNSKTWGSIFILAVLTGVIAHSLLVFAQKIVPIATISMIQAGQPAQSTFLAWVFLGETISIKQAPGMALVIIGSILVVITGKRSMENTQKFTS